MYIQIKDYVTEAVILEEDTLEVALHETREWFIDQHDDGDGYGEFEKEISVVTMNDDGEEIGEEKKTLNYYIEKPIDAQKEWGTW